MAQPKLVEYFDRTKIINLKHRPDRRRIIARDFARHGMSAGTGKIEYFDAVRPADDGGFDTIVVTAGIFVPSDTTGHIPDDKWALTFNINVTGSYLVADEAAKTWRDQNLRGNLVLTTSANAVVSKKGSLAYDTSKAAANHLVRELAIELAPLVRVNGVAPATVVQGSAMFPRDRVIGSLAKYNIPYTDDEATESLVKKLAQFYADRTLTKSPITPDDQAEAYFLLVTKRLSKTTGQVITVDGGLHEAFLR